MTGKIKVEWTDGMWWWKTKYTAYITEKEFERLQQVKQMHSDLADIISMMPVMVTAGMVTTLARKIQKKLNKEKQ